MRLKRYKFYLYTPFSIYDGKCIKHFILLNFSTFNINPSMNSHIQQTHLNQFYICDTLELVLFFFYIIFIFVEK